VSALPTCAVCGQPVERMESEDDDFMGRRVFTARCHGESERVVVAHGDLTGAITFGMAFTTSTRRLSSCP
jgi:hypothetical protein